MSGAKKLTIATCLAGVLGLGVFLVPVLFLTVLGGNSGQGSCTLNAQVTYTGPGVGSLNPTQMQRAAAVVAQGRQMGISDQGIVVALATASQESGFRVYANDGQGGDLAPDQQGVAASLDLPHDAVGTDHGSVGVFQQQWPWWGALEELMDPTISARKFYAALLAIPGWETLSVTVAAQRVQRSAYPDAYADDETLARDLLQAIDANSTEDSDTGDTDFTDTTGQLTTGGGQLEISDGMYTGGATDCVASLASAGSVVFPLPANSRYVSQNNFGQSGGYWSSFHTGNDFSVACGTPVLAVTSGIVEFDDAQAGWAGPNFVRITTGGPGTLATWYAHMETRTVTAGQAVTTGQQIGTVGDLGNSHGCHLHFEVHPQGGRIYEDPIDPVPWLAANVGKTPASEVETSPGDADTLTVLSYNVRHGDGGLPQLAEEITSFGAEVIALQEADNFGAGNIGAYVQWLAQRLGMQYAYAVNGTWNGKPLIDNAVLSKHPIVSSENTNLPGGPGIDPRGLLHVTVDVGEDLIDVYATHLHYGGDIRATQARKVTSKIGTPSCTTVLMGDMNATPNTSVYPELTSTLRDPFTTGLFGDGATSPNNQPQNRLDYVFHDSTTKITDAKVMPAGVSDHRAVRATVSYQPEDTCE